MPLAIGEFWKLLSVPFRLMCVVEGLKNPGIRVEERFQRMIIAITRRALYLSSKNPLSIVNLFHCIHPLPLASRSGCFLQLYKQIRSVYSN